MILDAPRDGRVFNSLRNVLVGCIAQIMAMILSFVGRTVFINVLGAEYLGLNGLFTNVLSVLSLADLGCNSVFLYSLYVPVRDNDLVKVGGLLHFYKKAYNIIAFVILICGCVVAPFLPLICNSKISLIEIELSYFLMLFSSVCSYFVVYKTLILVAEQKNYLTNFISLFINLLKTIIQICTLKYTGNYYIYITVIIITNLLNNFILNIIVKIKYPDIYNYINEKNRDKNIEKGIIVNLKSMLMYKLSLVAVNNTDNILISSIVNTITVGIYSNYSMVVSACTTFIGIIYNSIQASVGNLNAGNDNSKQYLIFKVILLFYNFIASLGFIGFCFLFNNLILIWIGSEYIFDEAVVFVIALNFYISMITTPILLYRETYGLFKKVTPIVFTTAFLNLILSIVLGNLYGILGILSATSISKIFTIVWFEPKVLFNVCFEKNVKSYWEIQFKYIVVTLLVFFLTYYIITKFFIIGGILNFVINCFIILIFVIIMYLLFFSRNEEFVYLKDILIRRLK